MRPLPGATMKTLRATSTILGLKADPFAPTHAGETFECDDSLVAGFLGRCAEEVAGDDLLEQAGEAEAEAERLRTAAAQEKAAAEQKDLESDSSHQE